MLLLLFSSEVVVWEYMASNSRFTSNKVSTTLLLFLSGTKFLFVENLHSLINFFVGKKADHFSRVLFGHIWGLKVVLV
jgi:hypothetical protein